MSNKSGSSSQAVSLPHGGGALQGIGETFKPDPFMGTGRTAVPIELPPGRGGFQPTLSLSYSTGNGGGPFGLGWDLSVAAVTRKTAKGVPRYLDVASDPSERDVFLLSGSEELVPIAESGGVGRFRPRTERRFDRIERLRVDGHDAWRVASRDGLVNLFGTPLEPAADAPTIADPVDPRRVFAWKLSSTTDPFGNRVVYRYRRDRDPGGPFDQLYLERIEYGDVEENGRTRFLVSVRFVYDERPDPCSDFRAGFEIRTRLRCTRIEVRTHADAERLTRTYELAYVDQRVRAGELPEASLPANGLSLLSQVRIVGHDGAATQAIPPLEFSYTPFAPRQRTFQPLSAVDGVLPTTSLANDDTEMVGLFGNGLPDLVQVDGTPRVWRNLGGGVFDGAQALSDVPAGVRLRDPGVQLADMNGDGRADLLVLDRNGYFPQSFLGNWRAQDFVRYTDAPGVTFADAELRLIDLDGDGVVDALRTGAELELFFNDPRRGWAAPQLVSRSAIAGFPDVGFADPRVKLADLNGDNLQDLLIVEQGRLEYWPYLGHGRWGAPVTMAASPVFQDAVPLPGGGFDPRRVLLGDLDGDGLDDIVYIEPGRMTFWINQAGRAWSAPIIIDGTPAFPEPDAVRLADVLGTGFQGVLWTSDQSGQAESHYQFLELTGGVKPYVLTRIDNHLGRITTIAYSASTAFYSADFADPATRWKSPLPFPMQVVTRVEVIDEIAGGKVATEYRYHHGYWDGLEREFRGFGLVEQLDTESFADFHAPGAGGGASGTRPVDLARFSPPMLTRTWFHLGDAGDDLQRREEIDVTGEYWPGDAPAFERDRDTAALIDGLTGAARASALRALRGSSLRVEVFALDGSDREDRPFTVTEQQYGLREEDPPPADSARGRVFFPHLLAKRTTQWERGDEPMTQVVFSDDYDRFGQPRREVRVAVPRHRDFRAAVPAAVEPYLATITETRRAQRDDATYIVDRVAMTTTHELTNDGTLSVAELYRRARSGTLARTVMQQTCCYYDGHAFVGLPSGQLGAFGAMVRSESLVLTEALLRDAMQPEVAGTASVPPYFDPVANPDWTSDYPEAFRASLAPLAGYTFADGSDHRVRGYFVPERQVALDVQTPGLPRRGLPVAIRDAFGEETTFAYDRFHLLPERVTDPAGLVSAAEHDYRVLHPRLNIDANGNRRLVTFTPLGLVAATVVMGKAGEPVGDTPDQPGSRVEYDYFAFVERRQPVSTRTISRVHHAADTSVPASERDEVVETVQFFDGFGRLLQTRALAEDVRIGDPEFGGVLSPDQASATGGVVGRQRAASDPPNVVVSGWQVYDNKGRVLDAFEPFFATGFAYGEPGEAQLGRRTTMFYDPMGRVVRTTNADGSERRVMHGIPERTADPDAFAPTPWEAYTYDENDLAPLSRAPEGGSLAGGAPSAHHFTPASITVDALGRTVESVARNGVDPSQWLRTRSAFDIRGNVLAVVDALDRVAFRRVYDLADRAWRVETLDAGVRRIVVDADGSEIERRDSKGALLLTAYDRLRRPVRVWARDTIGGAITLRQRLEYGDGGAPDQAPAARAAMRARNLLGQIHRHHDEAGLMTVIAVDFKGFVAEKSRRVIADAAILAVFDVAQANGWNITPFQVDWEPGPGQTLEEREAALLETTEHQTTSSHDALGRSVRVRLPQDVEGRRRELRADFARGGMLQQVRLDDELVVERIACDASGRRVFVAYGNGVMTRQAHDPRTGRLARLRSERFRQPDPLTYRPDGGVVQDYAYTTDLAGNVVAIQDVSPRSGFLDNPDALSPALAGIATLLARGDALVRRFEYDALYRVVSATGRECDRPPAARPWEEAVRCEDLSRARGYSERYTYDGNGNVLRLEHRHDADGFVRAFTLEAGTNRLRRVDVGGDGLDYTLDANGNLRTESGVRHFDWGHGDRLAAFRTQTVGVEPSVHAHYLRDAAGRRVKKLVRRQGGGIEVTDYVDGIFEHRRWRGPSAIGAQDVVHVRDDDRRLAVVRIGPAHPDERGPAIQIHLADHLGSSHVVVDGRGGLFNREDYTPFGETSFGAFARKRYRFGGKERDDESGLGDHGARAYAPWLARWVSADPDASEFPAWSPYCFAFDNPLRFTDPSGRGPVEDLATAVGEHRVQVAQTSADLTKMEGLVDRAKGSRRAGTVKAMAQDTFLELEAASKNLGTAGDKLGEKLEALRRDNAGNSGATKRLDSIESELRGAQDVNRNNLERAHSRTFSSPKMTAQPKRKGVGQAVKDGLKKAASFLGSGKPPKLPGGKAMGAAGKVGHLGAVADVIHDVERGHYVKAGAKTTTYALSLRASTPLTLGLSVAWGAYEHKDDPDIKKEAFSTGERVENFTGSKVLGAMVAAKVNTELAVSAAVMDMARAGFESSLAGQLFRMLDD